MIIRYSDDEIKILKDNYKTVGNIELGEMIGRSADSIKNQMKRQGIFRTPDEINILRRKLNKGQYKPNHKPHNTKYNGYERITKNGYIEIRLRQGEFRLKHIVEWEKINGNLPKSHCLRCLSDDKLNTNPDNWELITRAENIIRNQNREKSSKSLKAKWDVLWHLNQLGIKKSWYMYHHLKKQEKLKTNI